MVITGYLDPPRDFNLKYILILYFILHDQWRIQDFPLGGVANFRHRHFSVKKYAKTKELDPDGGGRVPAAPPGSANDDIPQRRSSID